MSTIPTSNHDDSPQERLTLYELNRLVRDVISFEMPGEYWVEAEVSECHESRGHCYIELIQKDRGAATPVARASARCWASTWQLVGPYFERTTGERLHAGLKVLLKVHAQFHEAYGFSWVVTDIDPTYTLGDMARKRQEIVRQLKEQGVFDLQRELRLPLFCQRIAVISSATAAGYGDFCNQLADNPYGLRFHTRLFPAIMQGEGVERSIIDALNQIDALCDRYHADGGCPAEGDLFGYGETDVEPFDAVVIIRGGGATSDLSGFDTLALAENVANFPLPIITGIGHERDESVLDMVSHTRVKTPTAAAAFLVSHLKGVLDLLDDAQQHIARHARQRIADSHLRLTTLSEAIPRLFSVVKTRQEARVDALFARIAARARQTVVEHRAEVGTLQARIPLLLDRRITAERHRIEVMAEKAASLDPRLPLRRGYSITLKDGKAVRDPEALAPGDELETLLEKGSVRSVVQSTHH